MKVLHYKTNFLNPSETFIDRLVRNHTCYEPIAMCVEKKHFADHLPVFEQPQYGIPKLINTLCFHLNLSLPFYKKVIEIEQPDIIHAHFGFDGWRMYKVAEESNTPLLVSFHGSDVSRLPTEFDWKRRYKNLAAKAQGFTAISYLMKKQLINLGFPKEKIEVIRTGVNIEDFSYTKSFDPTKRIMMAGRMVEKKGFEYALKAIKFLKKKNTLVQIDLFGDGPLKQKLEKMTKEFGIEDQVRFFGYVSNDRIKKELQKHSIFLAPSVTASDKDKEGLPVTILEAMASGVPVIASDHSAIPEAVNDEKTGLLVPERDFKAIAYSILKLLEQKIAVDKIRRNARELIEEQHSVNRVVQNTENLYTKIISTYAQ